MSERGSITLGPIAAIVVIALAIVGLFAVCTDDDDEIDTLGRIELASHDGRCYEGDCYDQWNNDQHNHNRRNRGAFSPGPFEDSPVDAFNGNTICLPGSTCYSDRRDEERGR